VTFLIPVFGVIWGAIFLNEKIGVAVLLPCLVILLGTALASGRIKISKR